ncbi:MAG: serine aminopeptidase domain-containing protein, partial [Spirochaetota bacterium]
AQVRPGDTVLVAGGTYEQTVWLRASGDQDRPITFRAMPGQRVTIDGGKRRLFAAFVGNGKHHVVIDSFYGVNLGRIGGHDGAILAVDQGGMFVLSYCNDVLVQRCFKDGRGPGYSPSFMVADGCDSLTLRNNVELRGFNGPKIINSPNLRVENNVFFYNLICQLSIINHSDQTAVVANNIFTDGLPKKFQAPMITVARVASLTERNNCFYARGLSEDKHILTLYGDEAFDPLRVLAEPWASKLAYDTTRQCVGAMQSHYPDRATDLFRVDFMKSLWAGTLAITHPELYRIMEDNRAGLTGHGVPVLILQGTDDIVVDRRTQDRFVITLREAGSDVRYLVYEGARHDTRQISWPAVVEWIDALP